MSGFLYDIALSFCPASFRATHRPHSAVTLLWAAILLSVLQTLVFARLFVLSFFNFLAQRGQQYGHMLERQNGTTQIWFFVIFGFEYLLFHPLAWLLNYMAIEGFIRFAAGVCVGEVIPSLPVVLAIRIHARLRGQKARQELLSASLIPDLAEVIADCEHVRIASSQAKARWTPSLTIGIGGDCYEVEREERGSSPRPYVYVLRKAPIGKALRGYEEYDVESAIKP